MTETQALPSRPFWRTISRHRGIAAPAALLAVILLSAIILPPVLGLDPYAVSPRNRLQGPSATFWLGTDNLGRDLFARILVGARTSFFIAGQAALLASALGAAIGIVAAYFPALDGLLMRICDGLLAIPGVILAVALSAVLGFGPSAVVLALAIVFTPSIARTVRSRALAVKRESFVEASEVAGAGAFHIMWKHIFPNTISVLAVQAIFFFADAIITEAALSFLGAGVPIPEPSWGNILADGKGVISRGPHMIMFTSASLIVTVVALNLLADGLRDLVERRR